MGRQIAVDMRESDEALFWAFLQTQGPVQILQRRASHRDQLNLASFEAVADRCTTFLLWNTRFAWTPDVQPLQGLAAPAFHIAHSTWGPVLEYTRCLGITGQATGRIYWPKVIPHPNPHAYDVEAFSRWFDSIVRWVKAKGQRGTSDQGITYFLPAAWQALQRRPLS